MKISKIIFASVLALTVQIATSAQTKDSLRVSILGDSYSTFEGWIPRGQAIWYYKAGKDNNDVNKVEQTWWYLVTKEMGYKLEMNNSYSGATICFTGYKDKQGVHGDYSDRSFIVRASNLGNPDIILVCGCTNDAWCGAPVGEYKWKNWTNEELHTFRPAMAKMCNELKTLYPDARIIFMLNSDLKEEINESVHKVCKRYRIECLDLHDVQKQAGHPSQTGMRAIASQVEEILR